MTTRNSTRLSDSDAMYRGTVWRLIQLVVYPCFRLLLRIRVKGAQRLDEGTGGLLLINHQSFLDPIVLGLGLRRPVSFLARDSLFRVFLLGWILKKTHVLPINRRLGSVSSIRMAVNRIKSGCLVGLFPEGTRTSDGQVGEFKSGFIALLRRVQSPVYPVGIAGAFQAMPRGGVLPKFGKIRVVYGAPIAYETFQPFLAKGQEYQLVNILRQQVLECQRQAEEWRDGGSKTDNNDRTLETSQVPAPGETPRVKSDR
ncbi:MAG: lysophospholipid acyltransferase family protein [Planctomycetaceae bacterium]